MNGFVSPLPLTLQSIELISSETNVCPDTSDWAEPPAEFTGVDGEPYCTLPVAETTSLHSTDAGTC